MHYQIGRLNLTQAHNYIMDYFCQVKKGFRFLMDQNDS